MNQVEKLLNEKIIKDFHKNNKNILEVLQAIYNKESVKKIAKTFSIKEQSVRNIKLRYKKLLAEVSHG